jgi:hypothetical protein
MGGATPGKWHLEEVVMNITGKKPSEPALDQLDGAV